MEPSLEYTSAGVRGAASRENAKSVIFRMLGNGIRPVWAAGRRLPPRDPRASDNGWELATYSRFLDYGPSNGIPSQRGASSKRRIFYTPGPNQAINNSIKRARTSLEEPLGAGEFGSGRETLKTSRRRFATTRDPAGAVSRLVSGRYRLTRSSPRNAVAFRSAASVRLPGAPRQRARCRSSLISLLTPPIVRATQFLAAQRAHQGD